MLLTRTSEKGFGRSILHELTHYSNYWNPEGLRKRVPPYSQDVAGGMYMHEGRVFRVPLHPKFNNDPYAMLDEASAEAVELITGVSF